MTGAADGDRPAIGSDVPELDLRRLVDSGPFGYLTTDTGGDVRRVNSTLLGWLGFERDDLCDRRAFQDLLAPGDRIYFDTHVRPLLHMGGAARDIAVDFVDREGERFPVLMSAEVVQPEGESDFVEIVAVDARSRRSYERELLRERASAQRARERVQLLYELVSGFADASTVAEIEQVVTGAAASPFSGVRCHMWVFSEDFRTVTHVQSAGTSLAVDERSFGNRTVGSGFAELASGQIVVVEDRQADADRYPVIADWLARSDLCSAIVAPLRDGRDLIGALSFGFVERYEFDDEDHRAVRSLAVQTSHALRRTRLLEARARSRARLESLYQFGRSLGSGVAIDDVVATITQAGFDHFGADDVRVGRLHRDGTLALTGGREGAVPSSAFGQVDAADIAAAAVRDDTLVSSRTRTELSERFPASPALLDGVESVVAVPLGDGDRIVGVWVLGFDRAGGPDEDDATLMRLFAVEASGAIRRAVDHERRSGVHRRAVVRQSISEALNRAATSADVAEALVVEGQNAFDADGLAVLVVNDGRLSLVGHTGLAADIDGSGNFPTTSPVARRLLALPAPLFAEGAAEVERALDGLPFGEWGSAAVLPLGVGGRSTGLIVVLFDARDTLDVGERRALAGIAAEASVAIGRAQMFDIEHEIAVTLQRSLIADQPPRIDGWRIDAWYSPSHEYLMVGGDLFDAMPLDDGRLVVIVGDVVGHGLDAAASLGQLRSSARALALDRSRPGELLERLDEVARTSPGLRGASICCVFIEPDGRGRYACAGHPYPLLVDDGQAALLTGGRSPLLGLASRGREDAEFSMTDRSTIVLYTDGVVERRDVGIDDGIERLRNVIGGVDLVADEHPARTVGTVMLADGEERDDAVVACLTRVAPSR